MSLTETLGATPLSIYLREAPYPFPVLIIAHILTIACFGGIVIIGNLRVLGWALRDVPVSQVIGPFRGWKAVALAVMLATGTLLAASDPVEYSGNPMFWVSNALLVAVGVNALVFCRGAYRELAAWDRSPVGPPAARRWARISLALWITLVFAGRAIAFF